jgi:hypothetical protein
VENKKGSELRRIYCANYESIGTKRGRGREKRNLTKECFSAPLLQIQNKN